MEFSSGLPGCMVDLTDDGKLLFTGGIYMPLAYLSGSGGGQYIGGFDNTGTGTPNNPNPSHPQYWNPYMWRLPGTSGYTIATIAGHNDTSTYFRMVLDPVTFQPVKEHLTRPLVEQLRDYIYAKDKHLKAPNQFALRKEQYYGYYDADELQYVIEQIPIH